MAWRRRPLELLVGGVLVLGMAVVGVALGLRAAAPSQVADAPPQVVASQPEATLAQRTEAAAQPVSAAPTTQSSLEPAQEPEPPKKVGLSTHVVSSGESLRAIADQHGLTAETLAAANALADPDLLKVGQELVVPAIDGVLHTVLAGETLRAIASRYGIELADLIAVNDLGGAPDVLTVGKVLVVPGVRGMLQPPEPPPTSSDRSVPPSAPAEAKPADAAELRVADAPSAPSVPPEMYTVREGDTLRGIAQTFGLDILTLVALNGLSDPDLIAPGHSLRIKAPTPVEHVVKPGDTLANIAAQYSVSSVVLLENNGIRNADLINPGMVLLISGGVARSVQPTPAPPTPASAPKPAAAAPKPAAPAPAAPKPAAPAPAAPKPGPNGERVITAKVTGYALGAGAVSNRTASGTTVRWGTVAADTRLYPFGTRLRIDGFPETTFVVEDTGSAVRGNVFDIWFPDAASARRLGAHTRQVTILP